MIQKIKDFLKKRKKLTRNKKGEGLTNQVMGIVVGAIIMGLAFTTGAIVLNKANYHALRNDFKDISSSLETMLVEHPKLPLECGQTYDYDTRTFSEIDESVTTKYIEVINQYLDESLQFDPDTCQSAKQDRWGNKLELYISTQDIDIDPATKVASVITSDSIDTEIRIIIKGLGRNSTIQRTPTKNATAVDQVLDDKDDCIVVIQSVNGAVKSGTYGFDKTSDNVYFANDTAGARSIAECIVL